MQRERHSFPIQSHRNRQSWVSGQIEWIGEGRPTEQGAAAGRPLQLDSEGSRGHGWGQQDIDLLEDSPHPMIEGCPFLADLGGPPGRNLQAPLHDLPQLRIESLVGQQASGVGQCPQVQFEGLWVGPIELQGDHLSQGAHRRLEPFEHLAGDPGVAKVGAPPSRSSGGRSRSMR